MNTLKWVLWFILVVLVFFIIGIGIYYGIPYVYHQWIKPIEEQSLQIQDIKIQQAHNLESFSTQMAELNSRLHNLTLQQDKTKEEVAALHQQVTDIHNIKTTQQAIANQLSSVIKQIEDYATQTGNISQQINTLQSDFRTQQAAIATFAFRSQQQSTAMANHRQDIVMLQVVACISQSRMDVVAKNYGLAQDNLQTAHALLSQFLQQQSDPQNQSLTAIAQRMEWLISADITDPVLIQKELDVVWQMLIQLLSNNSIETPSSPIYSPSAPSATMTPSPLATEKL